MKLVIVNRGEIARRILKAGKERGYEIAVISTQEDKNSLVCREADIVLEVSSFLNANEILNKCKAYGADLIHPGYGFLSENSEFARLVENSGITFVGPTSVNMKMMGSKEAAKKIAQKCGVPTLNALLSHELKNISPAKMKEALDKKNISLPYLVKASGGGGGRGMRVVEKFEDLQPAILRASEEAKSAFNDETVFVERYLKNPRHIEIQVFGDGKGGGVFWGERECSLQRRHQKVVEEAPSSFISELIREKMGKASLALVHETQYRGAGTVEYLVDAFHNFYFLEMNTRLQVEHPVTEMVYGIDLVHAQFDLASGQWPSCFPDPNLFLIPIPRGVSLEARILAEDSKNNFFPTPGKIEFYKEPFAEGVRVDSGVTMGDTVNPNFDSMIAKLIVHAPSRTLAIQKLARSLEKFPILGFTTNIAFLRNIVCHPDFLTGEESTGWIEQNLKELNKDIISESLFNLFSSLAFRERLSFIMADNWNPTPLENIFSQFSFTSCMHSQEASAQAPSYFEIKKAFEPHSYILSGVEIEPIKFYATRISLYEIQIFYLAQTLVLICPRRLQAQTSLSESTQGEIKTPMPGKLYDILVKEGDLVAANQVLCIVESMKMQLEVKSPFAGKLEKFYFEKGQSLAGSDIIASVTV